jgi:hypothetical protein
MDWVTYFIVATTVVSISLTWRMLLLDHPTFDRMVESVPVIGNGLVCGFCVPMWLTFFFVIVFNPIAGWSHPILAIEPFGEIARLVIGWFSTATAVLLIRFAIVALFDGAGLLSHSHHALHKMNTKE